MKKGWKIALISIGSLLGTAIIVIVIALWLVFTPARLTSIVNKLAGGILQCENHFERVELSLFKTYPNLGLKVDNVVLINPYQIPSDHPLAAKAQPNDTLAHISSLVVGIDLKAYLHDKAVVVRELWLDGVQANLYTAPDGWSNISSIFKSSDDQTPSEPTSSESTLPQIDLQKITLHDFSAQYCNLQQQMLARLHHAELHLQGQYHDPALSGKLLLVLPHLMVDMRDSLGAPSIYANLHNLSTRLDGKGTINDVEGCLKLAVSKGDVSIGDDTYTTSAMNESRRDLVSLNVPFHADMDRMAFTMGEKTTLQLLNYQVGIWGDVSLPHDQGPMQVDVHYATDRWQVASLLAILPSFITQSLDGMQVDGRARITGTAQGPVSDGQLPRVAAQVEFTHGFFSAPKMLPMPVRQIDALLTANLNLSSSVDFKGPSTVEIDHITATANRSKLSLSGQVDDLLDDMLIDADIQGQLHLPDLAPFLPDTMHVSLAGSSLAKLHLHSRLSAITDMALEDVQARGTLDFNKLDVIYDSIHATSPRLKVALQLPVKQNRKQRNHLIGAHITGGELHVDMANTGLNAQLDDPDIRVTLPNILDPNQPLAASFNIASSHVQAEMDSMLVYSDTLTLRGSVRNDSTQQNPLLQWHPDVDIDLQRGVLAMANMDEPLRLTHFQFNYKPEVCDISHADLLWGVSDYHLSGKVYNIEDWLNHTAMLHGDLHFNSQYADIDQLLTILSGMGTEPDTLAQQRIEDNVPKEANPFIVPKDVRVTLHTNINRCVAFGNDLNELAGSITVNDGVAVLDQVGFTCKAARMQLTGIYKSPRVNHLFTGIDFHLLDITVEELIAMVPSIDTLVPMLKAFQGRANFHLAAECNLNAFYQPKMSTLIGAAAINGKDLVVMDNATIASLAKLLQFKNWREHDNNIGIDSLSVEAQVFRKEITVYPFLLGLHNYQLCIGGRHTLDNLCNYHLELIKCPLPVRLAVDVNGSLSKPNIKLGSVQYGEMYKPEKRDELQTRTLELKRLVRQALEANVR
ncbi:MAG: AsmA family protein [Bacteroidales bacterium]|nr:AsmA family protein [Bacteroidales bacterium]